MKNKLKYTRNISWQILKEEIFVFDEITGNIHILKGVSKSCWLYIDMNLSIQEIIEKIKIEYTENDIENKVEKILAGYVEKNFVEWC